MLQHQMALSFVQVDICQPHPLCNHLHDMFVLLREVIKEHLAVCQH